ncbi:hypothetical protein MD484_g7640, partial [Candolleomyces efflorescens]
MDDDGTLHSPFTQRLGTNYIPSHREVAQISAILHEPLQQLSALDVQISALQAAQTKLKAAVERHIALCHPIRRFPNELLEEVFGYCLPTTHLPVMNALEAPMLLTHVCRLWRNVALSMPKLWTSLHIPAPYGRNRDNPELDFTATRLECVEWWLSHCKRAPLDRLSVYFSSAGPVMVSDNQSKLTLGTITEHAYHIRELTIDLHDTVLTEFSNIPPESFPLLEKIVVYGFGWGEGTARGGGIGAGSVWKAPKLTKIVWNGVGDVFLRLPLDWKRMQEIHVVPGGNTEPANYLTHMEARALIEAAPNVANLKVTLEPEHDIEYLDLPEEWRTFTFSTGVNLSKIYTLSHLTSLDILDCIYRESGGEKPEEFTFLSNLLLPALTTLKYDISYDASRRSKDPLVKFLQLQTRHHPVLITKWRVSATSMNQGSFFECLTLMPKLQHLHLRSTDALYNLRLQDEENYVDAGEYEIFPSDNLLDALLPAPSRARPAPYLCPDLKSLRCDSADFSVRELRSFVHGKTARVGTTISANMEGYVGFCEFSIISPPSFLTDTRISSAHVVKYCPAAPY